MKPKRPNKVNAQTYKPNPARRECPVGGCLYIVGNYGEPK